ncbi:MAG: permease [Actinobacteria bacterium]|nr:permease [Actinomycetota bacterium]
MSISINIAKRESRSKQLSRLIALVLACFGLYWINNSVWNAILFKLAGLDETSRVGESIHFFFYDATKITLLLVGITFAVTYSRSFITIEKTQALLGGKREGIGNVIAASAGIVTPFCSCSAVPVFIGFLGAGIPIGVTLSFLIASPLINEIAVGLLFTMFGFKIAALYLISGLLIAITAGLVLGRLKVERWVEPFVFENTKKAQGAFAPPRYTITERTKLGITEAKSIFIKIWPYLLAGIALGASIHGWVPTEFFTKYAGSNNPFAVVLAVLVGVPLYSNAAGVMPIVQALYEKGLPMGTLLAFMMSVVALSLPEMILLRRVLKVKLLACFIGVVAFGIIFVGYLFNAIL